MLTTSKVSVPIRLVSQAKTEKQSGRVTGQSISAISIVDDIRRRLQRAMKETGLNSQGHRENESTRIERRQVEAKLSEPDVLSRTKEHQRNQMSGLDGLRRSTHGWTGLTVSITLRLLDWIW